MKFQLSRILAVPRRLLLVSFLLIISAANAQAESVLLLSRFLPEASAAKQGSRSHSHVSKVKIDEKGDLLIQYAGRASPSHTIPR